MDLENSQILKEIGLNDKNRWILHEEKSQKFFEFIANNLDSSNILTDFEMQEYENLVETKKALDNEELAVELKNIEHSFPGFFSVTDDMLDDLENEVKELENDIAEKSERITRMKDFENEQLRNLVEIERKNTDMELKQRLLTDECLKKSKELTDLQSSNSRETSELNKIFTQQPATPIIMSQMPLDTYFHKCNQLIRLLELYMNRNFNIKSSYDYFSDDEESQINNIYQIKSEIIELEKKKFEEQMNVAGVSQVIEHIDKYKNLIRGDYYEIKTVIDNLMFEKENLETHYNVVMAEAQMLVENAAEQKVMDVFHEFYKGKLKRASERAEKINKVHELTDDVVYISELLWVALQLDLNRLKNRVDNSEEMNNQSQKSMMRIRKMKQLAQEDRSSLYSHQFLSSFQNLLIENLNCNKEDLGTIENCFKQYISYDEQIKILTKMLVEQKQLSKVLNSIKLIDEQSSILKELLFCGPTNKPRLYDPKFITPLYTKQLKKKELEDTFHDLKAKMNSKVVHPFENDKFHRFKELLYLWFCTEPKKMLLAIKEVQAKAAEEGSASYKALNVTLRE